ARGDGVQVGGKGRDEGLTFTGLHLGDVPEVEGCATHQLHVEVPHAQGALGSLTYRSERFRKQVVEGLAVRVPLTQFDGLIAKLVVGEFGEVVFELVDRRRVTLQLAEGATLSHAKYSL